MIFCFIFYHTKYKHGTKVMLYTVFKYNVTLTGERTLERHNIYSKRDCSLYKAHTKLASPPPAVLVVIVPNV